MDSPPTIGVDMSVGSLIRCEFDASSESVYTAVAMCLGYESDVVLSLLLVSIMAETFGADTLLITRCECAVWGEFTDHPALVVAAEHTGKY